MTNYDQYVQSLYFSIYIDAVVNHMTGHGASGSGTGGSSFNGNNQDYPGTGLEQEQDRAGTVSSISCPRSKNLRAG